MKNILFILFLFSISVYSQIKPKGKTVIYDYCPFECCKFGKWVIKDSIKVYKNEADTSSVYFRLSNNDTVFAETGNLHFIQTGKVVVTQPVDGYKVNDTLQAFNCSEGEFLVKHNGEEKYVEIFWPEFSYKEDDTEENYFNRIKKGNYSGRMIKRPETVWWVKIRSEKGEGWLMLKNRTLYCFSLDEKISGMDDCE